MAPRRRTARRRTTTRRTPRRAIRRKKVSLKVKPTVAREIWAVIYLAVGILTILSLQGAFGVIGDGLVSLLKPIFGWGIYVIPGVFILISAMLFVSKKIHFGAAKILGLTLFIVSILSVFHLSVPVDKIHDYAALGEYGGYVGFVTNFLLLEVAGVGRIAATIIFTATFLISLLLLFELSLGEIIRYIIPEIKIEMAKEKASRGRTARKIEKGMMEENVPEILIHKNIVK